MKTHRFRLTLNDVLAEKLLAAETQTSLPTPQILTLLASRYLDDFLLWHGGSAPIPPALPTPKYSSPEFTEETLPPITL